MLYLQDCWDRCGGRMQPDKGVTILKHWEKKSFEKETIIIKKTKSQKYRELEKS